MPVAIVAQASHYCCEEDGQVEPGGENVYALNKPQQSQYEIPASPYCALHCHHSVNSILPGLRPAHTGQHGSQQDHHMGGMYARHLRHATSVWPRNHSGSFRAVSRLGWRTAHSDIFRHPVLGLGVDMELVDRRARSMVLSFAGTRTQGSTI